MQVLILLNVFAFTFFDILIHFAALVPTFKVNSNYPANIYDNWILSKVELLKCDLLEDLDIGYCYRITSINLDKKCDNCKGKGVILNTKKSKNTKRKSKYMEGSQR